MGTLFRLVFYARDAAAASQASRQAFDRIEQLNRIFSDYLNDSEVTLIGQSAGGPPRQVSDEFFRLVQRSQELSAMTEGAFDITCGPVVRQWRRARHLRKLPTTAQIEASLTKVGHHLVTLDPEQRTIRLQQEGMILDFGGIAKGFACDEAIRVLQAAGISAAMVLGGGDIRVHEPPPGKTVWEIAIADPDRTRPEPIARLGLKRAAVSTSGDIEQNLLIDGVRYSHIVDPKTGLGLTNQMQATIIAPVGADADALATALVVMGPDRAQHWFALHPEHHALLRYPTPAGVVTWTSPNWSSNALHSKELDR